MREPVLLNEQFLDFREKFSLHYTEKYLTVPAEVYSGKYFLQFPFKNKMCDNIMNGETLHIFTSLFDGRFTQINPVQKGIEPCPVTVH